MCFEGFYNERDSGGLEYFVMVCSIAACMQNVEEVGSKFHLWPQIVGVL